MATEATFTSQQRRELFLEMVRSGEEITADQVHERARKLGDEATIEAYYNLGRRLAHSGILVADKDGRKTVYRLGVDEDKQWLDEETLARIAPVEYPLIGLTILKTVNAQMRDVPELTWEAIRDLLIRVDARDAFSNAVKSYCDDFHAALLEFMREERSSSSPKERSVSHGSLERDLYLLVGFVKFGLGLSNEAVRIPASVNAAIRELQSAPNPLEVTYYDEVLLQQEVARRVADETLLATDDVTGDSSLLIGAIDGSTRAGLLSIAGEGGDMLVGSTPVVAINTAIGQIDKNVRVKGIDRPAFLRLPEKPEDMQQRENRYTMMVKTFHPELSDSEYAHAVWAAMDLLESRAASHLLSRWTTPSTDVEVRPSDVVLRDGTVVPNDRDFNHYRHQSSYGRIIRELIERHWDILRKTRDDHQVMAGVVKNAQLRVFAPVINWVIAQEGARDSSMPYAGWPLGSMNYLDDQALLTRILTAGRGKNDLWIRSCTVMRPFHATTNYAKRYSRSKTPRDIIFDRKRVAMEGGAESEDELEFWRDFRDNADPFVQMLTSAWYVSFFLGCMPRLDGLNVLPRLEFMLYHSTDEVSPYPAKAVKELRVHLLSALRQNGFDVAQDHDMFSNEVKLDVLPRLCIEAHNTVKVWAADILNRATEYAAQHLSRFYKLHRAKGIGVSKWRKKQLEAWVSSLIDERNRAAGNPNGDEDKILHDRTRVDSE